MPQYLPLPDGSSVTIREGESPQQTWARAQQMYPEAFGVKTTETPQKEVGMLGSAARGAEQMISSSRTGLASLLGGNEAAEAGIKRAEEIGKKYPGQEAWEAVSGKYEKEGLLPAIGEYVKRVPQALAEQTPQIATSMAAARAGAATPVPGGAVIGAFTPSFVQQYGGFLERQAEEQKKRGEPIDVNRAYAAAAAIPAGLIDVAETMIPMGRGMIKSIFGEGVEKLITRGATKEAEAIAAKKLTEESFLKTLGKGTVRGAAFEVPGEVTQQLLERAQAGLPLFNDDALAEYGKTAFQTTMLGPLGAVGRFQDKSATQQAQEQEAIKQRAEQVRAEKEAEALKRQSPDYLTTFAKDYEDREAKFKAEKAAIKKPGKDATPEEQFDYKERKTALDDLYKSLVGDTPEYKRVKPLVEQVQEQQRVEKLSPEEYMLEQTMQGGRGAAPAPTGGRMKGALGVNEVPEPPKPDTRTADYAVGQIQSARNAGYLGLDDYADYLMQDPKMAAQVLQQRPTLSGLNKTDQGAVFGGLKLRLQEQEKKAQAESKAELAQRTEDLKAQQLKAKPDPLERYLESEQQVEEHRSTAETNFDYLNDMFTSAMGGKEPTIEINNEIKATADSVRKAPQIRQRVEELLQEADQADTDYANALKGKAPKGYGTGLTGQQQAPLAAKEAFERGNAAIDRLTSMSESGSPYAKEVLKLRQQQNFALNNLEDIADKLRRGQTLGKDEMAASTTQSLTNQAARMRSQYIQAALKEAATHRRAEGKPELTKNEAVKAASEMYDTLNEWIDRVQKEPKRDTMEEVLAEPAQMRAHKLISAARYEQRRVFDERPLEEYRFGAYPQAVAVLKEQLDKTRRDLYTTPSEATRETPILKQQFATTEAEKVAEARGEKATTLGGELRRRTEFVRDKMSRLGPIRPAAKTALIKAADVMDARKATRDLLDAVEAVVDANLNRRDIKQVDIRAINDALAAIAPTAMEQKEAGQKSLFPETEEDIGYIRMSPKNFANSPKIRPVWEAIDAARAATKRKADKEQKVAARSKAMAETVRRIETNIELLKEDTKFFWLNTRKWTDKQVAQAAVTYPEIGNTPEENALVDKYLKKAALTPKETDTALKLIRDFNSNKLPEYKKNLKQAEQLVAQGERLDDLDNQLLRTMQDTNKSVRDSAEKLRKELAPLKVAIDHITDSARKNKKETPLMKQIRAIEARADKARVAYRQRVEEMYDTAYKNMDSALAEILDPEIAKAQAGLKKAAETLKKEKTELERVQQKVKDVLAQPSGKDRMLLATYEQFRYEEKKSVIEDLEKKIQEQEKDLSDMMETREEAHDTTAAVLQAISDKKTQNMFEKVVALETQLATLRGEEVTTTTPAAGKGRLPNYKYPFAQQKLNNDLKAARAQLEAVQKEQKATNDKIKSSKEQVKKATNKFGLTATRRELTGEEQDDLDQVEKDLVKAEKKENEIRKQLQGKLAKEERKALEADLDQAELAINQLLNKRLRLQTEVTPIISEKQKKLDALHEQSMQQADRAYEAQRRKEIRELQLQQIDEEVGDLVAELGAYENLPNDSDTLRQLSEDENTRPKQRNEALAKLGVLQNIESLEAQRATLLEGKPQKKQAAATTETSLAQSARKAFRTGDVEAQAEREYQQMSREDQRLANLAAQEARGKKAEAAPKPNTRVQKKLPDENMGLFDDYEFSRGTPVTGLSAKELQKELEQGLGEKLLITHEEFQGNKRLAIYETPEEFMAQNPEYAGKIPPDAKGFVDDGKATLFANNIGRGHGLGVLLHEVGVHIGFRNFFNQAQYNALVNTVKNWASKTDNSIEAQIGKAAMQRVKDAKTPKNQIDDELLAYAVEEAMLRGVRPDGVGPRSVAQNWLRMIVDAFKKALSKFGINPNNLTAGDLVNFAYGCAQIELKGTWHGAGVKFDQFDHSYMGQGEGSQAFGWGTYRAQQRGIAESYRKGAVEKQVYRKEQEWLENPKVQAWLETQEPQINNATYMALSNFSASGKAGDVKFGIPYEYSDVLTTALAHSKNEKEVKTFVNSLLTDMLDQPELYDTGFESMRTGKGLEQNIKGLRSFIKTNVKFKEPIKTEPPVPKPDITPEEGALKRTLHLRPEQEYLNLDSHAEKQSRFVLDRIQKIFDEFDESHQKAFLRSLAYIPNPNYPRGRDVYNAISAAYELDTPDNPKKADELASKRLFEVGIPGNKFFDRFSRESYGTYNYVDFGDKREGAAIMGVNLEPVGKLQKGELLFSKAPTYVNDEMRGVGALVDKFVAKQKTVKERVQAASGGFLGLETQFVDRFAGFERLSKVMDALKGSQMMYYLRMFDQRMNFVSQAVANGALKRVEKIRADGSKEYIIESNEGASIRGVVETLRDAKQYVGNGEAVNRLFTMYMSGIRAKNKGFQSLNFGEEVSEADLKEAMRAVESNKPLKDIFDDARKQYNEYNRDMLHFVADSGAISEATRKALIQEDDYIPWYRERNGVAELVIGKESPIRIGSIAEQPYLHELVGGDRPILDFMTSAVQNTNMLADMGLRNTATKNAVFELVDMKLAKIVGASSGPNIVKFKKDGKDMYASIETDSAGIPADILVKGMEGIPTQMAGIWRLMAMPSQLLRKAVTLSPLYAARQLFRDSLAAPILSGADFTPVFGALKEINSATKKTLERRGVTGGQIFTGTSEDLTKILRDITEGKPGWMNLLAKAEALNMEADATTRRAQYNSYIAQGLSEMEATLMSLESMNFNKRGASPSVHIVGALIPFFNAQIQALNVLYKAFTGKMPFNERLKIQQKLLQRGGLLAGATLAYAAMMQDDEAYKNATPEQKYGNWFVRIPGVDEPIRIPVPFEIGYIFKAIPEALYNSMTNEHGDEEAVKAFKQILLQTIPGGTSYGIPQAAKPLIEYGLGKSFYTGRDILSAHEKSLLPEEQFRVNTSEAAKLIGKVAGVSPIMLEELVKGYTGTMGLAFLQAVSIGVPKSNTPEQAATRLSELPVVGGAFQPNDAAGIINATYDRFEDAIKLQRTVDNMFNEGRTAEGKALLEANMNEYMAGEMGDYFTTQMKELTQLEKAVQAMDISPEEKRRRLTEVRQLKISVAASTRRVVDEIAPR